MHTAFFDTSPSAVSTALFVVGWTCGWLMLCRPRHLPVRAAGSRRPLSVVIPARDEAHSIGATVASVVGQLRDGDEVIVVDDGSSDDTAEVARTAGASVLAAPGPPPGWAGKAHACAVGAASARGDILVFVDADVVLRPDALVAVTAEVDANPSELVSVQPWHTPRGAVEQSSLLFNVAALMGSGAFSVLDRRVRVAVAFGPVIAIQRALYDATGGHAAPDVRGAVLEDIALARTVGSARLFVGEPQGTTFRMYPGGLAPLIEGWTKGMGIGASATPWWALLGTSAWVTSLAGGWVASPWFALASLAQLAVLARIAGRFSPLATVVYPVLTAFFVAVVVRSIARRARGGAVTWKGRSLRPDQRTD